MGKEGDGEVGGEEGGGGEVGRSCEIRGSMEERFLCCASRHARGVSAKKMRRLASVGMAVLFLRRD
jgi:hypothetical protein